MTSVTPFNPNFDRQSLTLITECELNAENLQTPLVEETLSSARQRDSWTDENPLNIFSETHLTQTDYETTFARKEFRRHFKSSTNLMFGQKNNAISWNSFEKMQIFQEIKTIIQTPKYTRITKRWMLAKNCKSLQGHDLCNTLKVLDANEGDESKQGNWWHKPLVKENAMEVFHPSGGYGSLVRGTLLAGTGARYTFGAITAVKKKLPWVGRLIGGGIVIAYGAKLARSGIHQKASELQFGKMLYENRLKRLASKVNCLNVHLNTQDMSEEERRQCEIAVQYFYDRHQEAVKQQFQEEHLERPTPPR